MKKLKIIFFKVETYFSKLYLSKLAKKGPNLVTQSS